MNKSKEDGVIAIKLYSLEKKLEEKDKKIERLNNIIDETKENINDEINLLKTGVKGNTKHITVSEAISILKIILIQMD